MASKTNQPHFVLIPLMSQGHQIPMVDMAKLLANHGVTVTIVTTPQNAIRFNTTIDRAAESGLRIRLLQLDFPSTEVGLPEGCESLDTLPSRDFSKNFFMATSMLQQPLEHLLTNAQPQPSCIISDRYLAWTSKVARKLRIPRLVFDGMSCFTLMCSHNIETSKIYKRVSHEFEPFLVPGLPDKIELTKAQLPETFNPGPVHLVELHEEINESETTSFGLVVNTFEELEKDYVGDSKKLKGGKVWCIGPVSLCNKDKFDKSHRGNKSTIDEDECLKWLDSWPERSVVYVCLGTLSVLQPKQVLELGLALEASKRPFVWVIRRGYKNDELEKLICEDGVEERTKERGLLIRGWAPQLLILSHKAVGGFLTHCGWNSTLEGICAGIPMMTWPLFSDQFYNDKFVTQVLGIGVSVGVTSAAKWGEEDKFGVVVTSEEIRKAIGEVMDVGEEQEERRRRVTELGEKAKRAMEKGESSYFNVTKLIEGVMQELIE